MSDKRQSLPEFLNQARNSLAEKADHPWRQVKEAVGDFEAERWTVQQVQFSEDARMAARRALWFLRLIEIDSTPSLRDHARKRAHEQIKDIHVPRDRKEVCQPSDDKRDCPYSGAIEPKFTTLTGMWDDVVRDLGPAASDSCEHLAAVEERIEKFIGRSRPLNPFIRFTYSFAPAAGHFVAQHFALIAAFLIGLAICAGVEAVRSILMNAPRFTALVFAAALLPLTVLLVVQRGLHARRKSAPWNLGGRVVHSLPVSVEPARWRPWHPEGYARRIYLSLVLKMALHVALWIALGWGLAALIRVFGFDSISLTVYLIVMLWALVVLLGGLIDFADMHSPSPIRGMMLGGALAVFIAIIATDSTPAAFIVVTGWALLMTWWTIRVRNSPAVSVPLVISAAAILGIMMTSARQKDDVWSAGVATDTTVQLDQWPMGDRSSGPVVVLAASGGGSRAAIFTARTLAALDSATPDVAANLQAISSVSGGSLASAAYVARRLRPTGRAAVGGDTLCNMSVTSAVSRDFIQPTILGLGRSGGRGKSIQQEWERCPVGLGGITIDTLARLWREARARNDRTAPFPIPLFNSTTLERNAVVISPLDQRFFALPFDAEARNDSTNQYRQLDSPTWVFYRSGIYHLSDITGNMNAKLSAAVRASANFPFGFPLVEVSVEDSSRLWYSTTMARSAQRDSVRMVRLTDGGALSNSGMWPLVPLLTNQRDRIGDNRGVLMIVVDASRMPGAPWTDRQRGLLATLLDKNPKGERLHLQMLERLEATYGNCFGYVYIGIEPRSEFNVYTTWALDRASLKVVDSAFANAWRGAEPQVREEYARLQKCENAGNTRPLPARLRGSRVPLS